MLRSWNEVSEKVGDNSSTYCRDQKASAKMRIVIIVALNYVCIYVIPILKFSLRVIALRLYVANMKYRKQISKRRVRRL
jgi:hypothetical protein